MWKVEGFDCLSAASLSLHLFAGPALVGDFGGKVQIWGERFLAATALVVDFYRDVEICDERRLPW